MSHPRRVQMMDCHTPFLRIHTRAEHGGGAEQHTHRSGVHGIYHRLPRLVGLALLNEAHLAWRYAVILRQFALDFRIDVFVSDLVEKDGSYKLKMRTIWTGVNGMFLL